jgi:hypothetical protein
MGKCTILSLSVAVEYAIVPTLIFFFTFVQSVATAYLYKYECIYHEVYSVKHAILACSPKIFQAPFYCIYPHRKPFSGGKYLSPKHQTEL